MEKEIKPVIVEDKPGGVAGTVWIIIGAAMCILAYRLDLGSLHSPGPGFVAFLSGLFIIALGFLMVLGSFLSKHHRNESFFEGNSTENIKWRPLINTLCLLIGYAIFIEPVGFMLSTLIVMFGLFFDWQKRNWFWSLFFAVVTSLTSYVVFEIFLHCQLPHGIFPWW